MTITAKMAHTVVQVLMNLILIIPQCYQVSPILSVRRLKHRNVKYLGQSQTGRNQT